jgi:hypothetical protein
MVKELRVLNLGAGVQSTTLYLMILAGELPMVDAAIFADTGEEPVAVYQHLRWLDLLRPGLIRRASTGTRLGDDLMRTVKTTASRFAAIPAFTIMPGSEEEGRTRRQCSKEYKVEVIERTIRREVLGLKPRQRIPRDVRVIQYIGISLDESGRAERMKARRGGSKFMFPLIERFMTRQNCLEWLAERGNVPHEVPRSACVFCPFHDDAEWQRIKEVPEDWARAVQIDEALRVPGNVVNRNMDAEMFVHRSCKPLVQIELKPRAEDKQQHIGFWRDSNFSRECLGVCGL